MPGILIGHGSVRHLRLRPARHAFGYAAYFVLLPMRQLRAEVRAGLHHPAADKTPGLPINRPGLLSFYDIDHGDGRSPEQGGALGWLEALLAAQNIHDSDGEIWLQTFPRVLGFTFKPVSFWYCHRQDQSLAAIVAEVHNTFGERHCYVLPRPQWGVTAHASKVFHVSPFCKVAGQYRFRFMRTVLNGAERIVARVDYGDEAGALLETSQSGVLVPASQAEIRRTFWRYPLFTLAVVLRIHWQALLLWRKRVPFFRKPPPPTQFVTTGPVASPGTSKPR
ncbi:MAG: DUF1365 domain-containing protein [Rhodoferax sp.]|nr:DUF1365 domain-containing protein [Rhodoferax sp.]